MSDPAPNPRAWGTRALQLIASIVVLVALVRSADSDQLWGMLAESSLQWLGLAVFLKVISIVLHEVRLWHALPTPRPAMTPVVRIGLIAGTLNLARPARAGDLTALSLLKRDCGVSLPVAGAAVGLVAFLEMAVFAGFLFVALIAGASQWQRLLGTVEHARALRLTTLGTLAAVVAVLILVAIARRLRAAPKSDRTGPIALLRDGLTAVGTTLSTTRWLSLHLLLTAGQVALMIASAAALFPMLGLSVPLPGLAACGVMVGASVAAVVLPTGLGAGPAAVSIALLAPLGVPETGALAYAAGFWMLSSLPTASLGLPALWLHRADTLPP